MLSHMGFDGVARTLEPKIAEAKRTLMGRVSNLQQVLKVSADIAIAIKHTVK
jgi:hypothetical protein